MIRDRAVSRRYATALFAAAVKARSEEAVLADLRSLEALYEQDPALQEFLEAPDILTEAKMRVLDRVLSGRVHPLAYRLLVLMLEKKRVQHLPIVFLDYREMVEEHLGFVRARLTSAQPLDPAQREALLTRLERLTGKKIRLEARVNPAILGGLIVIVGDRILDGSLRHSLEELRERLLSARVA